MRLRCWQHASSRLRPVNRLTAPGLRAGVFKSCYCRRKLTRWAEPGDGLRTPLLSFHENEPACSGVGTLQRPHGPPVTPTALRAFSDRWWSTDLVRPDWWSTDLVRPDWCSTDLVRPDWWSTTLRMMLCRASYSSLVSGLLVERRAFCSSVITVDTRVTSSSEPQSGR